MKILEIQIENFGKFHNFSYKFNGSGIEILYGENEFGKTTLITFIQRILYGFPDKRHAENLYESNITPYGGRLLLLDAAQRPVTIERLGNSKGGTLRIFDTASGEILDPDDYIRQGAEFYRNIYMIHLKDLLSEASLLSGEIRHHLYGIERAFGNISPAKIQEILQKKCDALYRPKGSVQLLPKLAKELKSQEKDLSDLDREIENLTAECTGEEHITVKKNLLENQLKLAAKITALTEELKKLKNIAESQFNGEKPDEFLLANREKINYFIERRHSVSENHLQQQQLEKEISELCVEVEKLQFNSYDELENAKTEYEKSKTLYAEKLLRLKIAAEEAAEKSASFKKTKIIICIIAALLLIPAVAGLFIKIYPLCAFFLAVLIPFLLKKPAVSLPETPVPPEDKDAFFCRQYEIIQLKDKLDEKRQLSLVLQKKHSDFMQELQIFKTYLPENISESGSKEIAVLQQKLDDAIRCEIQFEIHQKNTAKAAYEAEKIRENIEILQNTAPGIMENIQNLQDEFEKTNRICTEISIRKQQLSDKNALYSKFETKYLSAKNTFNEYLAQYLKWKTALNIWEQTVNIFEKERQGDVMRIASELFSKLTDGKYVSIRKSISADNNLVVFDGTNDKTVDKLSSGTREQLLFVLRLALIEYIEKNAPQNIAMPLLMDDIFVNYDEKREQKAWEILKDFSAKRQIIFCRAKDLITNA